MNYINARVTAIDAFEGVSLVSFEVQGEKLTMISLELDSSLEIGSEVILGVKATTISLAKEKNSMLSISNQLRARIESIKHGKLLSSIKLSFADTMIESVITKDSALRLGLQSEDEIIALLKASDLSIVGTR